MDLRSALAQLDPEKDEHWTSNGQPRIDAVSAFAGSPVSREQITNAAPELTRETLREAKAEDEADAAAGGADSGAPKAPAVPPKPMKREAVTVKSSLLEDLDVSEESVLARPFSEVSRSPELLAMAIGELGQIHADLCKEREALNAKIKRVAEKSEVAGIIYSRIRKPDDKMSGIKEYLERQAEARAARAQRARAFLEAGTTQKDVMEQLRGVSRLDSALNARKPDPGSTRPAPGLPVRK